MLDLALQHFALDLLIKKGFTPVVPPFMINRSSYEGVTDLDDFEKVMYKIDGDDAYLIATSEHPIAAMYQDEIFERKDLPLRLCGSLPLLPARDRSTRPRHKRPLPRPPVHEDRAVCLLQTRGLVADPRGTAGKCRGSLYKLGLPYHVVNICTGDIGTVAAKKYDIEAVDAEGEHVQGGSLLFQLYRVPGNEPQHPGPGQGKLRVQALCPHTKFDRDCHIEGAALHP